VVKEGVWWAISQNAENWVPIKDKTLIRNDA
jgi:hypothetical protein